MKNSLSVLMSFFALGLFITSCGDATKAAEKTADAVSNTADAISDKASNAADAISDKASDAADAISDKVGGVADATEKMVKGVVGPGFKVGDKAIDFNLKNIDGKMVSMAGMKDAKGYIVTFTCNTCPYAVMYEDRLIDLHKKYAPQGYPVIAINPNDPAVKKGDSVEAMKVRAKDKSFPFVYLFDDGQKVYPKYGATKTPHVFLLDKDLTVKYIGAIDDNTNDASAVKVKYVENAIANIEAGKDPDPSYTKAIGCSIKTKKKKMM